MSKNILIVESDTALSQHLRSELEGRGCTVQETTDGKGSIELIRRTRPDLVVMAVDLANGQNGYLLCGKLKKDDDLKSVPVVITGDPGGFAKHRELKARADEYVAKPVDTSDFLTRVGALIGLPEAEELAEEVVEEELSPIAEEDASAEFALDSLGGDESEEIAVDTEELIEETTSGELDLDAAFDDIATQEAKEEAPALGFDIDATGEHSALTGAEDAAEDSAIDGLGGDYEGDEDRTTIGYMPDLEEPPAPRAATPAPLRLSNVSSGIDAAEVRELRARVTELEAALSEAESRASAATSRAESLEQDLVSRAGELEAARSTGGKSDKDFFALKEANNKKDKEILRLKTELNEKESELLELRDRETQLEQQLSEATGEAANREGQLKTLQARVEQLGQERRKIDRELSGAKEEARGATAKLSALQADFDQASEQLRAQEQELEQSRQRLAELESAAAELAEVRAALAGRESELQSKNDELESARNELSQQADQFSEEAGGLRQRISELEEEAAKHEERLTRLYARIKGEEQLKERTKKALAIAQQLLDEAPGDVEIDVDEAA